MGPKPVLNATHEGNLTLPPLVSVETTPQHLRFLSPWRRVCKDVNSFANRSSQGLVGCFL